MSCSVILVHSYFGAEEFKLWVFITDDGMMTSLRMAPPLHLIFLLIFGAFGAEWSVNYNQQQICALKRSTVIINGSYTLPVGHTVAETYWIIDPIPGGELTELSKNPDYSGRFEYFTDEQKHFSLKLINVMKKNEHEYCFRIITNVENEKWIGKPGVKLKVTALDVESPEEVTEGESADLTCKTTCSLTDPAFIWYKDEHPLTTKIIKNQQHLHLQNISSEDGGSYRCAVRGYEHLHSNDKHLTVTYSPKNVSISISSSSGEIMENNSVTLTCSSDANPPVESYTWFKGSTSVGKGKTYSIPNLSCEDSGEYTCQSQNKLGQRNSTAVYLNVLYPPKNVSISISNSSGEIVENSSVTLNCSSDANPPVEHYTWFKEGRSSPVGFGHSYSITHITAEHSGLYYCTATNQHGALRSAAVLLTLNSEAHGHSVILYVIVGVSLGSSAVLIAVVVWTRCRRQRDHGVT